VRFKIREAKLPEDYPEIVAIINTLEPERPRTAALLEQQHQRREPHHHLEMFATELFEAEFEPKMVATSVVFHMPWAFQTDRLELKIRVLPEYRNQGIGSELLRTNLRHLESLGAHELIGNTTDQEPEALRFLAKHGFVEEWRRFEWRLRPSSINLANLTELEARAQRMGVQVFSYAQLGHDPHRARKLYELEAALDTDIPFGQVSTMPSFEQCVLQELEGPDFLADATFLAVHERRFIGLSSLIRSGGYLVVYMTGVLKEFRGQGLATLLKLHGIRYAFEHGNQEIRTFNDHTNTAMLEMNAKLGFTRGPVGLRFCKDLTGGLKGPDVQNP
jgi:mycothiol synthase